MALVVLLRVERPHGRVGEPTVVEAPRGALEGGLISQEGDRQRILDEGLAELGDDLRRRVEAVEHAHEGRVDVIGAPCARRGGVPGEAEQMVPLVLGEAHPARDGREHLLGGLWPALLLEAAVVVRRHARERRDLLAAQATGAPARALHEPDVLGLQRLAAAAEEVRELRPVPCPDYARARPLQPGTADPRLGAHPGTADPGIDAPLSRPRVAAHHRSMTTTPRTVRDPSALSRRTAPGDPPDALPAAHDSSPASD